MPKRSHPDEAPISPLQMKTRVGEKEVNEGVNKEENMKHVYEKTLNMMMEGAKKLSEHENNVQTSDVPNEADKCSDEPPEIEPGQMYFSTSGKIAGVYEEVKDSKNGHDHGDGGGAGDCNGDTAKNGTTDDKEDEEMKEHEEEAPAVQKTTLSDVGFDLTGVKSSPSASPMKHHDKKSPVKVHKVPFKE